MNKHGFIQNKNTANIFNDVGWILLEITDEIVPNHQLRMFYEILRKNLTLSRIVIRSMHITMLCRIFSFTLHLNQWCVIRKNTCCSSLQQINSINENISKMSL